MVALSTQERKAAFVAACELIDIGRTEGAEQLGISWTHLLACMEGDRVPSAELRTRVADFVKIDGELFWGAVPQAEVA